MTTTVEKSKRQSLASKLDSFKNSFKWKQEKEPEVNIELFRVQMRQMMIGKKFSGPLIKDYYAHTNFRAMIEFNVDEDDPQCWNDRENSWALSNAYANKGTVSGYITANVILKGLSTVEHKVMKYKKRTADTIVSLLMYLGHERKVSKDPVADLLDQSVHSATNLSKPEDKAISERRAAWGLTSSKTLYKSSFVHQRYTYVLGKRKKKKEDKLDYQFVMALKTRCLGVDDIYSKHGTLVDTEKYDVEAAGEMTVHYIEKEDKFVLCLDNDSGTFRPSIGHIQRLKVILEYIFQHDTYMKHYTWEVVVASRPQLVPKKGKNDGSLSISDIDQLFKNYDLYMAESYPQASEQRDDILAIKNATSAAGLGF